jgi:Ca2+-binding RTX toxin-like protein
VTNIEVITLGAAVTDIAYKGTLVSAGATLKLDGTSATSLKWTQGTAETDGIFSIIGAAGSDSIIGGSLNDTITGGTGGSDTIDGGDGNDTITTAGSLNHSIIGGSGADSITGSSGSDSIAGGTENDTIVGSNGSDTLNGGAGDDSITGGTGNDSIVGDAGNDIIIGSGGTDSISGGAGNDLITVGAGSHTIDAGADTDTVTLTTSATATQTDSFTNVEKIVIATNVTTTVTTVDALVAAAATLTVDGANLSSAVLTWNGNAEVDGKFSIVGGVGADLLTGGLLADTISGGAGADSIVGGGGIDSLTGGDGVDQFIFAAGIDGTATTTGGTTATIANAGADTISDFTAGAGGDVLKFDKSIFGFTNATVKVATLSSGGGTLTGLASGGAAGDVDVVVLLNTTGFASYTNVKTELNATAGAITDATGAAIVVWYSSADSKVHVSHDTDISVGGGTGTEIAIIGNSTSATLAALVDANFAGIA